MTDAAEHPQIEITGVPQAVADAVRDIYLRTDGHGLAAAILEDAKDSESVLHGYFEWDDTAAAASYRMQQAENLVRRIKVTVTTAEATTFKVRAYVSRRDLPADKPDDLTPGSYVATTDIAGSSAYEAALLANIQRDVLRMRRKYQHVRGFFDIVSKMLRDDDPNDDTAHAV